MVLYFYSAFLFVFKILFAIIILYSVRKGEKMKFFQKLGKVLMDNIVYTVVLVVALICFFYFSRDLIAGLFTVVSALIIYMCINFLYHAYKKVPAGAKKTTKKK